MATRLKELSFYHQHLLNYTGRFSSNPEYVFLLSVSLSKKVQDSINIALGKVHGQRLTASQVRGVNSDRKKPFL